MMIAEVTILARMSGTAFYFFKSGCTYPAGST
jgi:hypothetical protein